MTTPEHMPKRLREIAEYACFDSMTESYRTPVENHPAWQAADRIEALEAALRQQRGWVQHWTADAEAGLKPSITALVTAVADIEATLQGEQQ